MASAADSPASAPRKDFVAQRFGANPPRDLVELREAVRRDIGHSCGIPRSLLDSTASGQAAREAWRVFVSTAIDGLARRIEAQILAQLGVEVSIARAPLGGAIYWGALRCFERLKEGGLTISDARIAAGI